MERLASAKKKVLNYAHVQKFAYRQSPTRDIYKTFFLVKNAGTTEQLRIYFLERIVSRMFAGNLARAARALHTSTAQLHQWLIGYRNFSKRSGHMIREIVYKNMPMKKHSYRAELIARQVDTIKSDSDREEIYLRVQMILDEFVTHTEKLTVYDELSNEMFDTNGRQNSRKYSTLMKRIKLLERNANTREKFHETFTD